MSIIEDLELLDLPDGLPDGLDFNLDDILDEFSTPGLFAAPTQPTPEAPPELTAEESEEVPLFVAEPLEQPTAEPIPQPELSLPILEQTDEDEEVKVYTPASKVPVAAEDDVKVYPSKQPLSDATIPFQSIDTAPAPLSSQPDTGKSQSEKSPNLFAKAAALVLGLFSRKKKQQPEPEAVPTQAPAEEDPFANLADLFALEGPELDEDEELMLEIELLAEREAEKEAEESARIAADRLAQEEAQKAVELEAQRLAQEEADAEARLKQQQAEEQARQEALAEEDLFEWIESASRRSAGTPPATPEQPPAYEPSPMEFVQEDPIPQPELSPEQEPSQEINLLLETPDIDAPQEDEFSETPEEAAARIQKEDDELRYVPEDTPAKTIASHVGKRFGAAFSGFAEHAANNFDREEDLGPELSPNKAFRFFNKYINGYRFRLRISVILSVLVAWISLGLPVFGSLRNPAVAAAMCLMILLTVMLAGADILASGVIGLVRRRPSIHTLVAVSCLASVLDATVIILSGGQGGYLPFCGVSAISMTFAIYGSLLYCRGQRLNFKTLETAGEPMTISVDYGIVDEDTTSVYRTPGHPESYIHRSEEEDLSEEIYGLIAPALLPAIPILALISALISGGLGDIIHIMASMFAAAAAFSAFVAFPLPYFLVQRDLFSAKAAVAGWAGVRDIGRVSTMIISDRDLFPDETVSIKSVRIVDNVPPQLTLSYMCSLVQKSGSCLVPAFAQLADNNDCQIVDVEDFQCHEAGGLSGTIGPDSVLVASHSYMKLQGFRIPARKKDSENALFLAVNGHVIAYIIMDYKAIKSVRAGLESALRGTAEMIFAARDFNVTPLLISKKFKSATETLRFPSYSQRFEITSQADSENAVCAAVVFRKSFYSYAVVVEKARNLYKSVSWAVSLSAVSSLMGVVLMFGMALTGAGAAVTVTRLLIFMLLWLVPTLALTVSITK